MNQLKFYKFLLNFLPFLYLAFFLSLFCGLRVMSSICVGGLLLFTLLLGYLNNNLFKKNIFTNYFVCGCLIFYLFQITALAYTNNLSTGIQQIQVKTTLLVVPVSLFYSNYLDESFREKIMPYYVLLMALAMFYCFIEAMFNYSVNHDSSVFFYHSLVSPFSHHAILFSILAFIGFLYLMERLGRQKYFRYKPLIIFSIAYYLFFIFLLASKIVIIFSFVSILLYISLSLKKSAFLKGRFTFYMLISLSVLSTVLFTKNPVSYRFRDIFTGNIDVVEKHQYNPGVYFNGIQFRLLEWKIVAEILNEHRAWLIGVSPGDAQDLLNKKYTSLNMFVGEADKNTRGFLGYNTHNEFLESALQNGILGLTTFLIICAGFIQMMIYSRSVEFWLIGTLLLSYCLVESVLQTQYGVLLFTFFPLFLFYTRKKEYGGKSSISQS